MAGAGWVGIGLFVICRSRIVCEARAWLLTGGMRRYRRESQEQFRFLSSPRGTPNLAFVGAPKSFWMDTERKYRPKIPVKKKKAKAQPHIGKDLAILLSFLVPF